LPVALVDGFSAAFLLGAVIAALGLASVLTLVRSNELEQVPVPVEEEPVLDAA
jgi:hypothetical protein